MTAAEEPANHVGPHAAEADQSKLHELDLLRISGGCFEPAITSDQRIGRAVVLEPRFRRAFELWNDPLGQNLAQLHTPLIKGIDLPDGALGEDAVFIERDQCAESEG